MINDTLDKDKRDLAILRDDIEANFKDIGKLKQTYFTAGNGVLITDNRHLGMDSVDISIEPSILINPEMDMLKKRVDDLEKLNKILAQYIYDSNNTKTASVNATYSNRRLHEKMAKLKLKRLFKKSKLIQVNN